MELFISLFFVCALSVFIVCIFCCTRLCGKRNRAQNDDEQLVFIKKYRRQKIKKI